jgi:hypothetical protein
MEKSVRFLYFQKWNDAIILLGHMDWSELLWGKNLFLSLMMKKK